jgi:hypothetical protein
MDAKVVHGARWRLLAHRANGSLEIENDGQFDELVVDDWLHIEQMEPAVWWLRVGLARADRAGSSEPLGSQPRMPSMGVA